MTLKKLALLILILSAISANAQTAEEYYNKGKLKSQSGDNKGALIEYDNALKQKPDYFEAFYSRGLAKLATADYVGADDDFKSVLKLKPNYPGAIMNRAIAKNNLLNYTGALADLNVLIESRQTYAKAYILRGQIKLKVKDNAGACEDFAKALEYGDKSAKQYAGQCAGKNDLNKISAKKVSCSLEWPDSLPWKKADSTDNGSISVLRYTKGEENLKNWTELVTITVTKNAPDLSLEGAMNAAFKSGQNTCPQAKLTQLNQNDEEEFSYIQFTGECPAGSTFYHLIQANNTNVLITYTTKKPAMDAATRDSWKEIISTAVKVEYK